MICYKAGMKSRFPFLLIPVFALLAACSPTVQDRIAKHRAVYDQLPKAHQQKIAMRQLEKGMSPVAVLIAWGAPDQKLNGVMDGKPTERWIYTQSGSGWSLGIGVGGFHGHRHSGIGTGLGVNFPVTGKAPVAKSVLFTNGKVESWYDVSGF